MMKFYIILGALLGSQLLVGGRAEGDARCLVCSGFTRAECPTGDDSPCRKHDGACTTKPDTKQNIKICANRGMKNCEKALKCNGDGCEENSEAGVDICKWNACQGKCEDVSAVATFSPVSVYVGCKRDNPKHICGREKGEKSKLANDPTDPLNTLPSSVDDLVFLVQNKISGKARSTFISDYNENVKTSENFCSTYNYFTPTPQNGMSCDALNTFFEQEDLYDSALVGHLFDANIESKGRRRLKNKITLNSRENFSYKHNRVWLSTMRVEYNDGLALEPANRNEVQNNTIAFVQAIKQRAMTLMVEQNCRNQESLGCKWNDVTTKCERYVCDGTDYVKAGNE